VARRNIVYVDNNDAPQECWICEKMGYLKYYDNAVSEFYCDECAGYGILIDRYLARHTRNPTRSESKFFNTQGRV